MTIISKSLYFVITLQNDVENLRTEMKVVTLSYCKNVREASLTFLVTNIALKIYVKKLLTKTAQTRCQFR